MGRAADGIGEQIVDVWSTACAQIFLMENLDWRWSEGKKTLRSLTCIKTKLAFFITHILGKSITMLF